MSKLLSGALFYERYRLQRRLGRGSFGEVWSAHDEVADVDVALKIYVALDDKGIEEFRSEFRNVINLVHTNILRPEHYDVYGSRPFLVMPLCRGSVEGQAGGMSEPELWHFIRDVSSGLAYLHGHEILHRDIKPDNILINSDGDYVISDFGISTRMRSTMRRSSMRQNKDANISGTIAYMAPEMFTSSPSAVKATDIWALGATLYELMTGELLFFGRGGVVQLNGAELPELPVSYSQDLRDTVASCLNMDTWSRPTASELAEYAVFKLKGEEVCMPWSDRNSADSKNKHTGTDSKKTERKVDPASGDIELRPKRLRPRLLRNKWVWLTLLLLLAVGGSFAGYKLSQDRPKDITPHNVVDDYESDRESDSAEIALQRQKDSLAQVEREQRAREERLQRQQDSLDAIRLAAKQAEEQRRAAEAAARVTTGTLNGHEWVDMGLSVRWATCNVGALSPSDYGNYYAWGETTTKSSYEEDNSRTYKMSKGDISGNPSYDAATANWGDGWRMPTKEELEELVDKCDWRWMSHGGHNGYKVTGPNGNSIFLPAAGWRFGTSLDDYAGDYGGYWSSTPDGSSSQNVYYMYFISGYLYKAWGPRSDGRSVRPVLSKKEMLKNH